MKKEWKIILVCLLIALSCLGVSACGSGEPAEVSGPACTVYIDCKTILDNMDQLKAEKTELIPDDGVILAETACAIAEGDTAMDVFERVTQEAKLQTDCGAGFIDGIANIYTYDCGEQSGWMYLVNDQFMMVGAGEYEVQEGDKISFLYSCAWGNDLPIEP